MAADAEATSQVVETGGDQLQALTQQPADTSLGVSRWRHFVATHYVWALPGLAMLALGRYQYATPRLWRDEMATWSAATRSVPNLLKLLHHRDAVAGAYYLFMHYWIAMFGDSIGLLRTPSIFAMAAAAILVALTGRRLYGPTGGLAAGLLFAVIPSVSRFAQEARSYAFAVAAVALATYLLVRGLERPTWTRWAAYTAAVVLVSYAHLIAVLILTGHVITVAWLAATSRNRRLWRWLIAIAAGIVALAPLAIVGRKQRTAQISWVPVPTLYDLLPTATMVAASTLVAGVLAGIAAVGLRRGDTRSLVLCTSGVVVPPVVCFAVSQASPVWLPRYLLFLLPAVALLTGRALSKTGLATVLAAVVVVGLLGWPDQKAIRTPTAHEMDGYPNPTWYTPPDWPQAGQIISSQQRPGDGIVYVGDSEEQRSSFRLRSTMNYTLRHDPGRPRDIYLAVSDAQIGSFWSQECPHPVTCLGDTPRVWVVAMSTETHLVAGSTKDPGLAALQGYQSVGVWHPGGVTIELVQRVS